MAPKKTLTNLCTGCGKRSSGDWCAPCARAQLVRDAHLREQLGAAPTLRRSVVGRILTRTWLILGGVYRLQPVLQLERQLTSGVPVAAAANAVTYVPLRPRPDPAFHTRAKRISDRAWAAYLKGRDAQLCLPAIALRARAL